MDYQKDENFSIQEVDPSDPSSNEVLVKIYGCQLILI